MISLPRAVGSLALVALSSGLVSAATQREIDAAIQRGTEYLKGQFKNGAGPRGDSYGIGPTALVGIALLEAKVPASDPAMQAIAAAVREASYKETKTYQLSLCLLFLDRLEDPADVPRIQMLAVRLLAGQNSQGGWGYECVDGVPQVEEQRLRAGLKVNQLVGGSGEKPTPPPKDSKDISKDHRKKPSGGKLHPEIEKYAAALWSRRTTDRGDDNSNTQFGVLAVWAARKHGVPVEPALELLEKRFIATQTPQGGWGYNGTLMSVGFNATPAMTCAGLLGLSVGVARREERRLQAEAARKEAAAAAKNKDPKNDDPFFNPPPKPDPKKKAADPRRVAHPGDVAIQRGLIWLGAYLGGGNPRGPGGGFGGAGDRNLYFLWSLERVGVIYGLDKIGGVDWYAAGADYLVRSQGPDGSWAGNYSGEIDTSFAVLFLTKSNVARDLTSKVQKDANNVELRAGTRKAPTESRPAVAEPSPSSKPPGPGVNPLPRPVEDAIGKQAGELVNAPAAGWAKALEQARDGKGADYTKALVLAIHRLEGDRKKQAREALAERLTRMSAETLRGMIKTDDAELRRGAVLACAMRDDKSHVPDLIDRLADDEDLVVRAARAGLKSLTGQDFGPASDASKADRKVAADKWRAWWTKQKK